MTDQKNPPVTPKPVEKMTHDRYFCKNMQDLEIASQVIRLFLPEESETLFQMNEMSHDKESYVAESGERTISDAVFRMPLAESETYISVMIEHKSQGAMGKGLHFLIQIRKQEVQFISTKYLETGKVPRVYLLGLYHGDQPYPGPDNVGALMDVPSELVPDRWRERLNILDLYGLKDEDLRGMGKPGIFLLAMKYIYDNSIMEVLRKTEEDLKAIDQTGNGREFLVSLFKYLYEMSRVKKQDELDRIAVKWFSEETGGEILSIAQQIRKEAREEGLVEGREEGREETWVETVQRMLARGYDLKEIADITGMPIERIKMIRDNT